MESPFFDIESVGGVVVAAPKPQMLDASNKDRFKLALEEIASGTARIAIDLSRVRFVDSSGLGVIMTSLKKLRASGGEMVVCSIAKPVKLLFDIVRLDRIMRDFPDRAAAVEYLETASSGGR